jgi:tetratricopeptide (TPR) repeat protein
LVKIKKNHNFFIFSIKINWVYCAKHFLALEMFEDTCYCYLASDMNKQAEELADKCIAREDFDDLRKANFWCIKGDIHNSVEYYETAWELSNKMHARSMRSLGALFVHLKRYDEAAAALKNALDLNHLQPGTWFAHGCASLVCGDYSGAAKSFRRCVTLGIRLPIF